MNQADVASLVSRLRIRLRGGPRRLRNPEGPAGRIDKMRETVTGLIKHERIELNYDNADEARGYAERLISTAIRNGNSHEHTLQMAGFWLKDEKKLVHKLFNVLVPRFQNYTVPYTRILKAPSSMINIRARAVLELRGNPYPPLVEDLSLNRNLMHNVLLDAAKKEHLSKVARDTSTQTDLTCLPQKIKT